MAHWACGKEVSHALLDHVHQGTVRPFNQQAGCKQQDSAGSTYRTSVDSARKEKQTQVGLDGLFQLTGKHELCVHMGSYKPTSSTFPPSGDINFIIFLIEMKFT